MTGYNPPRVTPVTRTQARKFIAEHHRHLPRTVGDIIRAGISLDGQLVGVGIAGRPSAPEFCEKGIIEITRIAVIEGTHNGCSMLYGALCRASFAVGWDRVITYIREDEPGTSVKAAGFRLVATLPAREGKSRDWGGLNRHRPNEYEPIGRQRWERP